jgi:hypothetical protein
MDMEKGDFEASGASGTGQKKGDLDALLGTYVKSSSTTDFKGKISGGEKWTYAASVIERYALQAQARVAMLWAFMRIPVNERPKRSHPVCRCRRWLRPSVDDRSKLVKPAIYKHCATGKAFYGGLEICGRGFACPVCSPKISEKRAAEVRKAVSQWVASGGVCLFVTTTFPHYKKDSLSSLMASFKAAMVRFRSGRQFDGFKKEIGFVGLIRALETTWGDVNGFHPHGHEIWFCRFAVLADLMELKSKIFKFWSRAVVASGLSAPSYDRGVTVKIAETEDQCQDRLAEYMAKTGLEVDEFAPVWGVDDEMVKAHSKNGKPGRFTPFDFLRQQYNPENSDNLKKHYLSLFIEFVEGFKGFAQVFWSPGLKAKFDLEDITDEKAAQEGEEPSIHLTNIEPSIWAFVIGVKDHRAELINKATEGGLCAVFAYFDELLDRYYLEHHSDDFERLSHDAQYLLALPDSAFISSKKDSNHV